MELQTPPVFPRKLVIALVIGFLICLLIVIFNGCERGVDISPGGFTIQPYAAPQVAAIAIQ